MMRDYIVPMSTLLSVTAPIAALLVAACLAATAVAEPAHPYGRDYLRAAAVAAGGVSPAAPPPDPAAARAAVEQLQARVEALELRDGPYGASLSEPLGDLARQFERLGRAAQAQRLRERALHLLRVNEGLYSPAQAALLREMLAADRRRGDFEALDLRYGYFFRLYGSGRAPLSPSRLDAALEYLDWQREALLRGIAGDPTERLLTLHEINSSLLETALAEDALTWGQLRATGISQLRNLYLIADELRTETTDTLQLYPTRQVPRVNNNLEDFDPQRERLQAIGRAVRRRGLDLLEELLSRAPGPRERAALQRECGDWELWLGRSRGAMDWYRRSWETLRRGGDGALQERWYGVPQPLPANGAFAVADAAGALRLQATVRVDAGGRVDEVEVFERGGAPRESRRLLRRLRDTRFRPALGAGGEPRAATLSQVGFLVF